jgi:hypothetical protein
MFISPERTLVLASFTQVGHSESVVLGNPRTGFVRSVDF